MISKQEILKQTKTIFRQMSKEHPELLGDLVGKLVFRVSKRMTRSAGQYNSRRQEIVLSYPFFKKQQYFEQMLPKVIAHELAHAIAPPYKPDESKKRRIHSPQWREVNSTLGGDERTSHQMQLPDIQEAFCECCGQLIKLTPRQYKWWLEGKKIYCHKGQDFEKSDWSGLFN